MAASSETPESQGAWSWSRAENGFCYCGYKQYIHPIQWVPDIIRGKYEISRIADYVRHVDQDRDAFYPGACNRDMCSTIGIFRNHRYKGLDRITAFERQQLVEKMQNEQYAVVVTSVLVLVFFFCARLCRRKKGGYYEPGDVREETETLI